MLSWLRVTLFLFLTVGVLVVALATPLAGWLEGVFRDVLATRHGVGMIVAFVGFRPRASDLRS